MRISFQTMTNHSNTCSMFCITVVGHHLKTDTHWDSCAISGNEYQKFSPTDTFTKNLIARDFPAWIYACFFIVVGLRIWLWRADC